MKRQQDPLAPRASSHMHLLSSHVLCPATKLLPRLHLPMSQMHRTLSRVWILASFSNMVGEGRTKTLIWSTWTRTHISFSRMQPMHTFPSTLHYSHFEASPKSLDSIVSRPRSLSLDYNIRHRHRLLAGPIHLLPIASFQRSQVMSLGTQESKRVFFFLLLHVPVCSSFSLWVFCLLVLMFP